MATQCPRTEIKVGIFVLIALIVLGYMSFRLAGESFSAKKGYPLCFIVDTASGLAPNSRVEMAGIPIGYVRKIRLYHGEAKVCLIIYKKYKIAKDATVWVRTKGILGDKYVEIHQGHVNKGVLPPGGRIAKVIRPEDLDELFVDMGPVFQDFKSIANSLAKTIGSKQGEENIKETLSNIRSATASLKVITAQIKEGKGTLGKLLTDDSMYYQLKDAIASINKIATNLNKGKGTLGKLLTDDTVYMQLKDTMATLKKTVNSLNVVADRLKNGEGTLGKLMYSNDIYNKLQDTVNNLDKLTKNLNSGKGTLGKLLTDDSLYKEAQKTLHNVNKAAQGLNEQVPVTILGAVVGAAVR